MARIAPQQVVLLALYAGVMGTAYPSRVEPRNVTPLQPMAAEAFIFCTRGWRGAMNHVSPYPVGY
ncbi:hypothetical protein [Paenibacillus protaetiae]|uniref:Uncharacterized protein n=1 Tax=Paenibacillus protaetiae TaxID=2509456 RepID=A0A4P6EYM2_9BACL|nr:hypothetical protein [Paenibacillus protaetiae]QAY67835.1 hypothetical protein ET464_17010 [Paenibacillus protaetiae]